MFNYMYDYYYTVFAFCKYIEFDFFIISRTAFVLALGFFWFPTNSLYYPGPGTEFLD